MHILLIEDDKTGRVAISELLRESGYDVTETGKPDTAIQVLSENKIDLIITDFKLPGISGYELLLEAKKINPFVKIMMITAYGNIDLAVKSLKNGADEFITKPIDDELFLNKIREIENDMYTDEELSKIEQKQDTANTKQYNNIHFDGVIGKSKLFKDLLSKVPIVAKTDYPVLIIGESGTGKELIANFIQKLSHRNNEPFIKINCGAIPDNLVESELFGYEKGAFTGAVRRKIGKIEAGNNGTVFLDEIGELPIEAQSKLLRLLENSEIQRLGSIENIKINVRIISATNRNLEKQIAEKVFREDLFFRLSGVTLMMPSLRERKKDIPLLADHFIEKYSKQNNIIKKKLSEKAMDLLIKYSYPGNIRELGNIIRYVLLFSKRDIIYPQDIPFVKDKKSQNHVDVPDYPVSINDYLRQVEKEIILKALKRNDYNKSRTAFELQINESSLRHKMKKLDIN